MSTKEMKRVAVVAAYARIAMGVIFGFVVLYLFATERIDIDAVLKLIAAALTIDRLGMGVQSLAIAATERD